MKNHKRNLNRLPVIFLIWLLIGCQTVETRVNPEIEHDLDRYDKAAEIIFREYVDPVSAQKLIAWSIEGIREGFDPGEGIEDTDNSFLRGEDLFDYNLKSSNDMEDVKSNFRSLSIHWARTFPGFSSHDFVNSAIKGMLARLDPQCAFLHPGDLQKVKTDTRGEFAGIGTVITVKGGFVTAMFSIEGTPAHNAGILPGDRILRVNGIKFHNLTVFCCRICYGVKIPTLYGNRLPAKILQPQFKVKTGREDLSP